MHGMPMILTLSATNKSGEALGAGLGIAFFGVMMLVVLALIVVQVVANWKIAEKSGYSGALSLLMLLPIVNLIIYLVFAFGEWPIERELKTLRARATTSA